MDNIWMAPIWAFGSFLILYLFHREKTKVRKQVNEQIHKERMAAIEKGLPYPELPPYNFEEEEQPMHVTHHRSNPRMMLVFAALLITGGFGSICGMIISENPAARQNWSLGLIPMFMGVGALLGAWILAVGKRDPR
jgi:hypothetical protein